MSSNHEFLVLAFADHSPTDYLNFINYPHATHVHDDLVHYIDDALQWIPTLNPATNEPGSGLNLLGVTAILSEGAAVASGIFQCWAQLFRRGPEELTLSGHWTWVAGQPRSRHYEVLRYRRDDVVATFERLARDCNQVATSNATLFVLHLGI